MRCNSLRFQFAMIVLVGKLQDAFIADYYQILGGRVVWNFRFRRDLRDDEFDECFHLLALLDSVPISVDKAVERSWQSDSKGVFFVCSFFEVLEGSQNMVLIGSGVGPS